MWIRFLHAVDGGLQIRITMRSALLDLAYGFNQDRGFSSAAFTDEQHIGPLVSEHRDQALDLFLGRSTTAVFEHYQALGQAIPEQFSGELRAAVRAAFLSALRPIDGVGVVLEGLQIPHCVASSSDIERVSFSLALTGLAPHFGERLYTSQMVERGKPAPDLFLFASERMRAEPAQEAYGALSILVQALADCTVVRTLPPTVFWPRPKVDSAVVARYSPCAPGTSSRRIDCASGRSAWTSGASGTSV